MKDQPEKQIGFTTMKQKLQNNRHCGRPFGAGALIFIAILGFFAAPFARAACETPNQIPLKFQFAKYPFWEATAKKMAECGNVDIAFDFDALAIDKSSRQQTMAGGHMVSLSNVGLHKLMTNGWLRPLDSIVEKYPGRFSEDQLVRVGGRIMGIRVAVNVPLLAVHSEFFREQGFAVPQNFAGMIALAQQIKAQQIQDKKDANAAAGDNVQAGVELQRGEGADAGATPGRNRNASFEYAMSLPFKNGWNLTFAFASLLASQGHDLVDKNNKPGFNNTKARAALEQLKAASALLPPEFLKSDSNAVVKDLQRRKAPMGILWASSAGGLDDPRDSLVLGKFDLVPVPAFLSGGRPAAQYWWDGVGITTLASDEQAEAAIKVLLEGLDAEAMVENREIAIWMMKDFKPGRFAKAALDAVRGGIGAYPASPANELAYQILGQWLEAAMNGSMPVARALAQAEKEYLRAAKERGLIGS